MRNLYVEVMEKDSCLKDSMQMVADTPESAAAAAAADIVLSVGTEAVFGLAREAGVVVGLVVGRGLTPNPADSGVDSHSQEDCYDPYFSQLRLEPGLRYNSMMRPYSIFKLYVSIPYVGLAFKIERTFAEWMILKSRTYLFPEG